jgi:hypothetical protein
MGEIFEPCDQQEFKKVGRGVTSLRGFIGDFSGKSMFIGVFRCYKQCVCTFFSENPTKIILYLQKFFYLNL